MSPITFTLPETRDGQIWERVLDTSAGDDTPLSLRGGEELDSRRSVAGRPVHAR